MKKIVEKETSLLELLAEAFPQNSKSSLRSWIKDGRVLVDGLPATRNDQRVAVGDTVTLGDKRRWIGKDLRIVYEDEYLVAVDKPEGMLSVSTAFETNETAFALVKAHYHPKQVYVIHRLDQDTSGVMIFALNETCFHRLKELFIKHDIERLYSAVVAGTPEPTSGTWKSYLYEDARYVVHETDDPSLGELAITHYRVLESTKKKSRIELKLETGKKNQIRVHCSSHGCPIIGDKKYGDPDRTAKRLCLHAQSIAFVHPMTQKPVHFASPVPDFF
jgi:tRNA pseudouridine32 synthase/23S rRNA pseudouridine746 synthase/23S rRNA pseudouridine1911/1915/1917 synthase